MKKTGKLGKLLTKRAVAAGACALVVLSTMGATAAYAWSTSDDIWPGFSTEITEEEMATADRNGDWRCTASDGTVYVTESYYKKHVTRESVRYKCGCGKLFKSDSDWYDHMVAEDPTFSDYGKDKKHYDYGWVDVDEDGNEIAAAD